MSRSMEQSWMSRESNSWTRSRKMMAVGGTVSGTVAAAASHHIQYLTDVSAESNVAAELLVLNGTAFLHQIPLVANVPYNHSFLTPLKSSQGTNLIVLVGGFGGTHVLNASGYTSKNI